MGDEPPSRFSLFFNLPLEIREEIYYYALFQPPQYKTPGDWVGIVSAPPMYYDTTWWGTEKMTRTLRASRQVHSEAEAVLYSRFHFCFPYYTDTKFVHTVVGSVSARARSLIRSIRVYVVLRCRIPPDGGYADGTSRGNEVKWKGAFSLLVELLPGLRVVDYAVAFVGLKVPDHEQRHVVDLALRVGRPLKNVEKLTVSPMGDFEGQRLEIWRDVMQRVHAGSW